MSVSYVLSRLVFLYVTFLTLNATAMACSTPVVKLGPYTYKKYQVVQKKFTPGNMIIMYDRLVYFGSKDVYVFNAFRMDDYTLVGTGMTSLIHFDNSKAFLLKEDNKIYKFLVNIDNGYNIHQVDKYQTELEYSRTEAAREKIKIFVYNPTTKIVFYAAENLVLHVVGPHSQHVNLQKQVEALAYFHKYYYFYTGFNLERVSESDLTKKAEVLIQLPNRLKGHSIVVDEYKNIYVCTDDGPLMYNPKEPGNVEYFRNFSSCQAMIFYMRHIFLFDGLHLIKLLRYPFLHDPISPMTTTTTSTTKKMIKTTTKKTTARKTTTTKITTTKTTTPYKIEEEGGFWKQQGGDINLPIITIGFFFAILVFILFVCFVCYNCKEHGFFMRDFFRE